MLHKQTSDMSRAVGRLPLLLPLLFLLLSILLTFASVVSFVSSSSSSSFAEYNDYDGEEVRGDVKRQHVSLETRLELSLIHI